MALTEIKNITSHFIPETGKIEYEEFVFLMFQMDKARDPSQLQEDLLRAFKVFDRDGNNFIGKRLILSLKTLWYSG